MALRSPCPPLVTPMQRFAALGAWIGATLLLTLSLFAQEPQKRPAEAAPAVQAPAAAPTQAELDAAVIAAQLPSYPLDVCVVSGEPLGSMGEPLNLVAEGRLIRVCCKGCTRGATKTPAEAIAKIDAAVIAAQKPSYPLTTCPISGQELGEKAVDVVHGTRLARFCCPDCKAAFLKDPAPSMAKIDAALIEAQRASYPLTTCFISGEPLDVNGAPQEFLYGVQLVKVCCGGCKRAFQKDPAVQVAKLREAQAKAAAEKPAEKPAERPTEKPAEKRG